MRIETISMAYNEEFLLPFYLRHYSWVDMINILYDEESTDNSLSILKYNPQINIIPFRFPDGLDDYIKVKHFNDVYKSLNCDIVILSDIDEFLFADRKAIEALPDYPLFMAFQGTVYRNVNDKDLDVNLPIKEQRAYGFIGGGKPMIAQVGKGIEWTVGNHSCNIEDQPSNLLYAHWTMADPCFCIDRRVKNRAPRMSQKNRDDRLGYYLWEMSEQDFIKECKDHENDARIW
jgi:hypothetical protein